MNKSGKGWIAAGLLCIAAALCLIFLNLRQSRLAEICTETVLQKLTAEMPTPLPVKSRTPVEIVREEETEYPDYVLNPDMPMPVIHVDGYDAIGILSIPALELELPILSEWSYPALQVSPCRYSGSVYNDSLILCAHNYPSHFGRLNELNAGDSVIFRDTEGHEFFYRVVELETLQPTGLADMEDGNYGLTLFTCTLGGRSRFTLRCEKDE